jgi:AcrR family transcriptional regulator
MTRETAPATEERLRDADRSQNTILAAARDEFAEHGLGGARVERIAERAGARTRSLIYYYFDNKDSAVPARCWKETYRQIRQAEQQLHLHRPAARRRRCARLTDLHLELLPPAPRTAHAC